MNPTAPKKPFWRIGPLARAAGVSTDTLRHYEKKGILRAERSRNGYREYSEGALERVRMVRRAMAMGFTLDELSSVLRIFDRGGAPCLHVRSLAASKLVEIEKHLEEVIALRDELRESLKIWDARLLKTTSGHRAGLLMALAARNTESVSPNSLSKRKLRHKK